MDRPPDSVNKEIKDVDLSTTHLQLLPVGEYQKEATKYKAICH